MTVEEIKNNQQRLKAWGFYLGPINGVFDSKTQEAVMEFQKSKGLTIDGVVGRQTLTALNRQRCWAPFGQRPECEGGSYMIKEIQQQLAAQGLYDGQVDGVFGPKLEKAVIGFQASRRMVADGVVRPQTLAALGISTAVFA